MKKFLKWYLKDFLGMDEELKQIETIVEENQEDLQNVSQQLKKIQEKIDQIKNSGTQGYIINFLLFGVIVTLIISIFLVLTQYLSLPEYFNSLSKESRTDFVELSNLIKTISYMDANNLKNIILEMQKLISQANLDEKIILNQILNLVEKMLIETKEEAVLDKPIEEALKINHSSFKWADQKK